MSGLEKGLNPVEVQQIQSIPQQGSNESIKSELFELISLQREQISVLSQLLAESRIESRSSNNLNTGPEVANFAPPQSQQVHFQPDYMNRSMMMGGQQLVEYAQGIRGSGNSYGFMDAILPSGTRMSVQSKTLQSMDFGSRAGQAMVAGVGAAGGTALSFGLGSALPGIAGLGAGLFGGLAMGAVTDMSIKEMKKQSAYEKYLYKNSKLFINPGESNNKRELGGFSVQESKDAAQYLRTSNTKFYLKDEEMMMLTQKFTEGGMLKDTKDLEGFKKKIGSLTKNVKTGALMLNETYDTIADLMSELKKAGIDQKNFDNMMSMGQILGGMNGQSGTESIKNLIDLVSQLNYGTGVSNQTTVTRFQDTQIYMSELYDGLESKENKSQTEKMLYNTIKNFGGVEKASQALQIGYEKIVDDNKDIRNPALAFFDWNESKSEFTFDKSKFNEFLSGDKTITDLLDVSASKLQQYVADGNANAVKHWENSAGIYIKNNLKDGELTKYMNQTLKSYSNDMAYSGFDQREILSLLGVSDPNMQNFMSSFMQYREVKGDEFGDKVRLQADWQSATAKQRAETPSLKETISSGWENIKEKFTQPMVDAGGFVNKMILKATDKWYGYDENRITQYDKYFTMRSDLDSVSFEDVTSGLEKSSKTIASAFKAFSDLQDKGYTVDEDLINVTKSRYEKTNKNVVYSRDLIDDWDKTDDSVKKNQQTIQALSEKNDLSETIVAALVKYESNAPKDEKITKGDLEKFAADLGQKNFEYGGNTELALASAMGVDIDAKLKEIGWNAEALRNTGSQGLLQGVSLSDLEIDPEVARQIGELLKEYIGEGLSAAGPPETGESNTKEVYVYKDSEGADLTEREKRDLERQRVKREGFGSTDGNENIDNQLNFLRESKYFSKTDSQIKDELIEIEREITSSTKGGHQGSLASNYRMTLENKMKSGNYSSVEDILADDRDLREQREKVMNGGLFGRKLNSDEQKLVEEMEALTVTKLFNSNNDSKNATIESFAKSQGVDISNYNNLSDYTKDVMNTASNFYNENIKNLRSYLNGEDNESSKAWSSLSAVEKATTYKTLKELEEPLDEDNLDDALKTYKSGEKAILTAEEENKLQHLHYETDSKGKRTGKVIYDGDKKSDLDMGLDDLIAWKEGGEQSVNYGIRDVKKKLGLDGVDSSDLTLTDISNAASAQYGTTKDENMSLVRELNTLLGGVTKGTDKVLGNLSADEKKQIDTAARNYDKESLQKMSDNFKAQGGDGIGKSQAIDAMIDLIDKIESADVTAMMTLMSEIERITNIGKDLGNTIMYTKESMGSETYVAVLDKAISDLKDTIFEGNDKALKFIEKNTKTPEDVSKMLTDALINGGVLENDKGKTFELSAETMEKLISGLSQAQTESLKEVFMLPDEIAKVLQNPNTEKVLTGVKLEDGTDAYEGMLALAGINKGLSELTGEEKKKAEETQKKLIDELVPAYLEAIKGSVDSNKDASDTIVDGAKKFENAIDKYDRSIGKAIKKLEDRVDRNDWLSPKTLGDWLLDTAKDVVDNVLNP